MQGIRLGINAADARFTDAAPGIVYIITEKGGELMVGEELLLCDNCGVEIEVGVQYYLLNYGEFVAVCEECVLTALTTRESEKETNRKIVDTRKIA